MNKILCGLAGHQQPSEARYRVICFTESVILPTKEMVLVCPRCGTLQPGNPTKSSEQIS